MVFFYSGIVGYYSKLGVLLVTPTPIPSYAFDYLFHFLFILLNAWCLEDSSVMPTNGQITTFIVAQFNHQLVELELQILRKYEGKIC